jgi:hypothetical protein
MLDIEKYKILDSETLEEIKKARPLGLFAYGDSETGKSSLASLIAEQLGSAVFVVGTGTRSGKLDGGGLKQISVSYKGEGVINFDEISRDFFEGEGIQGELCSLITEIEYKSPVYFGTKLLAWPRKVIFTSNQDPLKDSWEISVGLRSRLLFVETRFGKDLIYKIWSNSRNRYVKVLIIEKDEVKTLSSV